MTKTHLYFALQLFKRNRTSVIAWGIVWTLLGLLFATVFKSMSETAEQSARIYQSLPPAVLKTVNISADYLTRPENFLSGQFLTIYLLAGSIFSVIMGVKAIGGRIQDRTILTSLTKRISRGSTYALHAFVIITTLLLMNIIVGIALLTSFTLLSGAEISVQYIIATFSGAALVFICFAAVGLMAGVKIEKSHASAIGSALAVISFFVNGLGALAGVPAWLQKLSLFYYFDTVMLRDLYAINSRIFALISLTIILIGLGAYLFRKKDIYL